MKKGFTLIEIIIYITIFSIISTVLVDFAVQNMLINTKIKVSNEVNENIKTVNQKIVFEIRNALDINSASSTFGTSLTLNSANKLSLKGVSPADPIEINVLNGQVFIKRGASSAVSITSSGVTVTNLTFYNNSSADLKSKNISFKIDMSANNGGATSAYIYSTSLQNSVELRGN